MPTPTCNHPRGCNNVAVQKCSSCGKVFCVEHVAFSNAAEWLWSIGWKCRDCFKGQTDWLKKASLISIGIGVFGILINSISVTVIGVMAAGFGFGLGILYGLLALMRSSFYRKNFPDET